jgi:hypothetical protein
MKKYSRYLWASLVTAFVAIVVHAATSGELDLGGNGSSTVAATNIYPTPPQGVHFFDDFISGTTNSNYTTGVWTVAGNAGGGTMGDVIGTATVGVVGRIGIISPATGTTNNATGQGFIDMLHAGTFAGQGSITVQWAARIPTLSTAGVEYGVEMGLGSYVATGFAPNSMVFEYLRTTSTNFIAQACNNSTCTQVTTADSADFAVVAGTWYNFKIVINAAGTSATFSIAPSGTQAFVTLATITTNLPDISDQCYPWFEAYKISSTATNRYYDIDWFQLDETFASPR